MTAENATNSLYAAFPPHAAGYAPAAPLFHGKNMSRDTVGRRQQIKRGFRQRLSEGAARKLDHAIRPHAGKQRALTAQPSFDGRR